MKLKHLLGAAGLALLGGVAGALLAPVVAQVTIPMLTNVSPTDVFHDIQNGNVSAQNTYVTAAQINGPIGYQNAGVLATAQTLTFGNAQTEIVAQSSGTIAALTLTASASPGDGQKNCYVNTQTTTAITWNANTGQTISGAPTAGVANTPVCMIYLGATKAWVRA